MTVDPDRLASLTTLHKGAHPRPKDGMCLLEAAAYIAGEPHSDAPRCVSPVLAIYGRILNDGLPAARRDELLPFVPRLVGTADDGLDHARSYLALDWLIRDFTPAWLSLPGYTDVAAALRDARPIVDAESAVQARQATEAAAYYAKSAQDEITSRVRPGLVSVAVAAVAEAAVYPIGDAAGSAGTTVAAEATQEVFEQIGRMATAAEAAASEAALVAAMRAAASTEGRTPPHAGAADAAREALTTVAAATQASAIALLDRMIRPTAPPAPHDTDR